MNKIHTTNYRDAFIEIAEDCPVKQGEVPPLKNEPTLASMQFDMIYENPYKYTSDDVIFQCYARKNKLGKGELKTAREAFFSKGQACLRSSPLAKRYGWGIHHDAQGKVALYGAETKEYKAFVKDKKLKVVKAMRSKRG